MIHRMMSGIDRPRAVTWGSRRKKPPRCLAHSRGAQRRHKCRQKTIGRHKRLCSGTAAKSGRAGRMTLTWTLDGPTSSHGLTPGRRGLHRQRRRSRRALGLGWRRDARGVNARRRETISQRLPTGSAASTAEAVSAARVKRDESEPSNRHRHPFFDRPRPRVPTPSSIHAAHYCIAEPMPSP
jgi:hypothetical protein